MWRFVVNWLPIGEQAIVHRALHGRCLLLGNQQVYALIITHMVLTDRNPVGRSNQIEGKVYFYLNDGFSG